MQLERLSEPFAFDDVEWRIQSSGLKKDKNVWARCVCYVTNRAIQSRLDEVFGPMGWQNQFKPGPDGGVVCGLSAYSESTNSWVTKWDGAENTDIEPVKGGLSGSMKRAGAQWGIGRYLYALENGFATTSLRSDLMYRAKTKEKISFSWNPPPLPAWALPKV